MAAKMRRYSSTVCRGRCGRVRRVPVRCPLLFERLPPLRGRAGGVGRDQLLLAEPRRDAVDRVDYTLGGANPKFFAVGGHVPISHPAPKRPGFGRHERCPGERPVEQRRSMARSAEEPLAILEHLIVASRSVRSILPAFGIEGEGEARLPFSVTCEPTLTAARVIARR
jgi:hypothetical protein